MKFQKLNSVPLVESSDGVNALGEKDGEIVRFPGGGGGGGGGFKFIGRKIFKPDESNGSGAYPQFYLSELVANQDISPYENHILALAMKASSGDGGISFIYALNASWPETYSTPMRFYGDSGMLASNAYWKWDSDNGYFELQDHGDMYTIGNTYYVDVYDTGIVLN
jgi:hypothetical protein